MIPPALLALLQAASYAAQAAQAIAPLVAQGRHDEASDRAGSALLTLGDALAAGKPVPAFRDDQGA